MSEFDPVLIDSGPSERGWSYYSDFLRCPMLFFWRHIYARREGFGWNDTTGPLARGTMFHVARAHFDAQCWARENGKDPSKIVGPEEAIGYMAKRIGDVAREMQPVVESMWRAYRARYPVESFKIVAVEEPVSMNFGPAFYTARLDRVVQEKDGRIDIHDTKTTARMEAKTVRKYTLHGQFFGFHYLGRKTWGDRFGGVVIDAIDEEGNCTRQRPQPAPFMMQAFPRIVEAAHLQIEAAKSVFGDSQEGWASIAHPDERICYSPYGQCSAFELCRWGHGS